jgi:hypothetical protein
MIYKALEVLVALRMVRLLQDDGNLLSSDALFDSLVHVMQYNTPPGLLLTSKQLAKCSLSCPRTASADRRRL